MARPVSLVRWESHCLVRLYAWCRLRSSVRRASRASLTARERTWSSSSRIARLTGWLPCRSRSAASPSRRCRSADATAASYDVCAASHFVLRPAIWLWPSS